MNNFASLFGFGIPELVFIAGIAIVSILIFLVVKAFLKGYSGKKDSPN